MRTFTVLLTILILSACSSTSNMIAEPSFKYCEADVPQPDWYLADQERGYHTTSIQIHNIIGADTKINDLVRAAIGHQVYSTVNSVAKSTYDMHGNGTFTYEYTTETASNLTIPQTRIQRYLVGDCLVAFGSLSPELMNEAIERKFLADALEREDWFKIVGTINAGRYVEHINRYPNGIYRKDAERYYEHFIKIPPNSIRQSSSPSYR